MILITIYIVEFKIMLNISNTVVVRFKIIIVIWMPKADVTTVSQYVMSNTVTSSIQKMMLLIFLHVCH